MTEYDTTCNLANGNGTPRLHKRSLRKRGKEALPYTAAASSQVNPENEISRILGRISPVHTCTQYLLNRIGEDNLTGSWFALGQRKEKKKTDIDKGIYKMAYWPINPSVNELIDTKSLPKADHHIQLKASTDQRKKKKITTFIFHRRCLHPSILLCPASEATDAFKGSIKWDYISLPIN